MIIGMTEIVGAVSVFSAVTTVVVWLVRLEGKQRLCEVQSANLERLIQLEVQKIELAQRDQDGKLSILFNFKDRGLGDITREFNEIRRDMSDVKLSMKRITTILEMCDVSLKDNEVKGI